MFKFKKEVKDESSFIDISDTDADKYLKDIKDRAYNMNIEVPSLNIREILSNNAKYTKEHYINSIATGKKDDSITDYHIDTTFKDSCTCDKYTCDTSALKDSTHAIYIQPKKITLQSSEIKILETLVEEHDAGLMFFHRYTESWCIARKSDNSIVATFAKDVFKLAYDDIYDVYSLLNTVNSININTMFNTDEYNKEEVCLQGKK